VLEFLCDLYLHLLFLQYVLKMQNESINNLIEEAILEAEERGAKVLSLGLLNQASFSHFLICFL
jgi:hypothetical protein